MTEEKNQEKIKGLREIEKEEFVRNSRRLKEMWRMEQT